MFNIRTDLALEAKEMYHENAKETGEIDGVVSSVDNREFAAITKVAVTNQNGSKSLGKPVGNYITIEAPRLRERNPSLYEEISKYLSEEIKKIVGVDKKSVIMVVGLGNRNITPDALGPKVVESMLVTRHLIDLMPNEVDDRIRPVCAVAPGVLGITGIETGEIIKGIVDKIKPSAIIAVDALASRRTDRVSTTIQITDTGINPGGGVGNKRKALNFETLGVPVIALGVPTVVDAATIASDSIDLIIDNMKSQTTEGSQFYQLLIDLGSQDRHTLINELLSPYTPNLLVTPKEIDNIISDLSKVIANGINLALHDNVELDEINSLTN